MGGAIRGLRIKQGGGLTGALRIEQKGGGWQSLQRRAPAQGQRGARGAANLRASSAGGGGRLLPGQGGWVPGAGGRGGLSENAHEKQGGGWPPASAQKGQVATAHAPTTRELPRGARGSAQFGVLGMGIGGLPCSVRHPCPYSFSLSVVCEGGRAVRSAARCAADRHTNERAGQTWQRPRVCKTQRAAHRIRLEGLRLGGQYEKESGPMVRLVGKGACAVGAGRRGAMGLGVTRRHANASVGTRQAGRGEGCTSARRVTSRCRCCRCRGGRAARRPTAMRTQPHTGKTRPRRRRPGCRC